MKQVSESSSEKLAEMAQTSRDLGLLWTTEKWADYVYTYICSGVPSEVQSTKEKALPAMQLSVD
jgi:hypothetical protein